MMRLVNWLAAKQVLLQLGSVDQIGALKDARLRVLQQNGFVQVGDHGAVIEDLSQLRARTYAGGAFV